MELEPNAFLLRESLEASMMMLKEKALKGGIALHLDIAPEADVSIAADQRKLKQILFNLLSNAVKFTHAGGTVDVSVVRDGDFIEITVADTGMGIREEDIPKLFQTFTQLESVYTKGFEGTGLGLALTRQLVELHGGRIWVKSEFGTGSRFSFTIPCTQVAAKEPPTNRPDTFSDSGGNTVLVIEDDPLTLDALENALLRKGYRALRASNGKEGVEMAQRDSPDLIVLDLVMPGFNGFEVADRLRNENVSAKVPILVLTSMDLSAADRARLMGKVWWIEGKGSLSTHEFLSLVESAVGPKVNRRSREIIKMPHKILIVEDNVNNRSLFRDILIFHGYEVSVAADGQEGVALAREMKPDLILMDIQMPGMDGMTAGGILKGDPATSGLKIVAITSFAMRGDQEKILAAGFDGYLSKPISTRELPGLVKQWLEE